MEEAVPTLSMMIKVKVTVWTLKWTLKSSSTILVMEIALCSSRAIVKSFPHRKAVCSRSEKTMKRWKTLLSKLEGHMVTKNQKVLMTLTVKKKSV
jgi:hypothetical protein